VVDGEGVHFRVWAPRRIQVEVVFESSDRSARLSAEGDG
jgi:1,4-alpha-glucan branching enzyme